MNAVATNYYRTMNYRELQAAVNNFAAKAFLGRKDSSGGRIGCLLALQAEIDDRAASFTEIGADIDYRPMAADMAKIVAVADTFCNIVRI